jgi:hypothetical protein
MNSQGRSMGETAHLAGDEPLLDKENSRQNPMPF